MRKIIREQDTAPGIRATDVWGAPINVPAQDKWIYLSFHRFATCPFCTLRTNELIRNYDLFRQHNVEVISIWPSDKDNLLRYAGRDKSPFPILSDKDKRLYKAYGVTESSFMGAVRLLFQPQLLLNALRNRHDQLEIDAAPTLMPASFLVDPDGVVQLAYYGKHYGDHPDIEALLQLKKHRE